LNKQEATPGMAQAEELGAMLDQRYGLEKRTMGNSVAKETYPKRFASLDRTALTEQVNWFIEHLEFDQNFFVKLYGDAQPAVFGEVGLTPINVEQVTVLARFSRAMTHILAWRDFDVEDVLELLDSKPELTLDVLQSPPPHAPPWFGKTLRAYLRENGLEGIERVSLWVRRLRFGDLYRPS